MIAGLLWGTLLATASAAPELTTGLTPDNGVLRSTDGVVDLKWSAEPDADRYQLEERIAPGDFQLRYTGPDTSSVRSGLAAGHHDFRVRAIDDGEPGEWSDILTVEVVYMAAGRVRLLLILGGTVVLSTIGVILHGHFSHRKEARS